MHPILNNRSHFQSLTSISSSGTSSSSSPCSPILESRLAFLIKNQNVYSVSEKTVIIFTDNNISLFDVDGKKEAFSTETVSTLEEMIDERALTRAEKIDIAVQVIFEAFNLMEADLFEDNFTAAKFICWARRDELGFKVKLLPPRNTNWAKRPADALAPETALLEEKPSKKLLRMELPFTLGTLLLRLFTHVQIAKASEDFLSHKALFSLLLSALKVHERKDPYCILHTNGKELMEMEHALSKMMLKSISKIKEFIHPTRDEEIRLLIRVDSDESIDETIKNSADVFNSSIEEFQMILEEDFFDCNEKIPAVTQQIQCFHGNLEYLINMPHLNCAWSAMQCFVFFKGCIKKFASMDGVIKLIAEEIVPINKGITNLLESYKKSSQEVIGQNEESDKAIWSIIAPLIRTDFKNRKMPDRDFVEKIGRNNHVLNSEGTFFQ